MGGLHGSLVGLIDPLPAVAGAVDLLSDAPQAVAGLDDIIALRNRRRRSRLGFGLGLWCRGRDGLRLRNGLRNGSGLGFRLRFGGRSRFLEIGRAHV